MVKKNNKQGQLGKFLTSVPLMILIFLIIAVFLVMSFAISKFKSPSIEKAKVTLFSFSNEEILLRNIEIVDENNVTRNMSVLEALVKEVSINIVREELKEVVEKDFEKKEIKSIFIEIYAGEDLNVGRPLIRYGFCRDNNEKRRIFHFILLGTGEYDFLVSLYDIYIIQEGKKKIMKISSYYGKIPVPYCKNE